MQLNSWVSLVPELEARRTQVGCDSVIRARKSLRVDIEAVDPRCGVVVTPGQLLDVQPATVAVEADKAIASQPRRGTAIAA